MPQGSSISRIITNAAIFIAMEVAAIGMLSHSSEFQNLFISKAAHVFMAKVWGGSESIKHYFSLKEANERLSQENFELRRQLDRYAEVLGRSNLDSMARNYAGSPSFDYTPAKVVKVSRNKQHNYLIIGKGEVDGIQEHTGIITPEGVVGIVDAVGKNYSYAISFMSPEMSVSARLGKEGVVGPMVWDGKHSDIGLLMEIPLQSRFERGDTVYTSGFSSIFPPQIPLGVTEDTKIVNGATYTITVRLFQDFSTLQNVMVVRNNGKEEMEMLESEEGVI